MSSHQIDHRLNLATATTHQKDHRLRVLAVDRINLLWLSAMITIQTSHQSVIAIVIVRTIHQLAVIIVVNQKALHLAKAMAAIS